MDSLSLLYKLLKSNEKFQHLVTHHQEIYRQRIGQLLRSILLAEGRHDETFLERER